MLLAVVVHCKLLRCFVKSAEPHHVTVMLLLAVQELLRSSETHDRPGTAALPSEVTDQELAEVFGPSPVAKAGAADDEDSSFGYNPFDHLDDEAGSDPSSEAIEAAEAAAAEETGDAETEEATSAAPAMTVVPGNRQKKAAKATGPKKRSLRQPDDVPLQLRAKR